MKKTFLILIGSFMLVGCYKDEILPITEPEVPQSLKIENSVGLKLESTFVTTQVSMNVKLDTDGVVTIKIFDISNRIVSKETVTVKAGDNILTVHTNTLPSSAYRIGLFNSNNQQLGITDFNKI